MPACRRKMVIKKNQMIQETTTIMSLEILILGRVWRTVIDAFATFTERSSRYRLARVIRLLHSFSYEIVIIIAMQYFKLAVFKPSIDMLRISVRPIVKVLFTNSFVIHNVNCAFVNTKTDLHYDVYAPSLLTGNILNKIMRPSLPLSVETTFCVLPIQTLFDCRQLYCIVYNVYQNHVPNSILITILNTIVIYKIN